MALRLPIINNISITGRLTRDSEILRFKNGGLMLKFDIAQSSYYKQGEEFKEKVVFIKVKYSSKEDYIEKLASKLHKGSAVYIDGTLEEEIWQDKDGNKRGAHVIRAKKIQTLDKEEQTTKTQNDDYAKSYQPPQAQAKTESYRPSDGDDDLDNLPF